MATRDRSYSSDRRHTLPAYSNPSLRSLLLSEPRKVYETEKGYLAHKATRSRRGRAMPQRSGGRPLPGRDDRRREAPKSTGERRFAQDLNRFRFEHPDDDTGAAGLLFTSVIKHSLAKARHRYRRAAGRGAGPDPFWSFLSLLHDGARRLETYQPIAGHIRERRLRKDDYE